MFSNSPFAGMSLEELLSNLGGYSRRPGGRRGRAAQAPQGQVAAEVQTSIWLDFMQAIRGCTTTLQLSLPDGSAEQIDVKIPPGMHEGSKIRVRGKHGHALAGDLYITVHVREHPYFRREGADILVEAPISITEAGLGGEVTVPTIDGQATVKIPPGASSGTKLRLGGKGVIDPRTGQRGDQYVVLKVVLPKTFSEAAQRLLRELARSDPYDPRKSVKW
jgi:DnaJ-class molecular chaperone